MESALTDLVAQYPKLAAVWGILTSAYMLACFVATLTTTDKDDKFLDKFKQFFSIQPKK